MNVLRVFVLLGLVLMMPVQVFAEYDAGIEFKVLPTPQPTSDGQKIEVVELFWYGCPHCYHFEPFLQTWLKNKPKNVVFVRIPAIFNPGWGLHARAYYSAEALGVVDKVHEALFEAAQSRKLSNVDQVRKVFVDQGIKASDFNDAWGSFGVDSRVRSAADMTRRYNIEGVPSLIINGKYVTDGPMANGHAGMLKVTDFLIKKEAAKLK